MECVINDAAYRKTGRKLILHIHGISGSLNQMYEKTVLRMRNQLIASIHFLNNTKDSSDYLILRC